jgi:predicted component of type VI protein secretion system
LRVQSAPAGRATAYRTQFAYDFQDGGVVRTVELPLESLDLGKLRTALPDRVEDAARHRGALREANA